MADGGYRKPVQLKRADYLAKRIQFLTCTTASSAIRDSQMFEHKLQHMIRQSRKLRPRRSVCVHGCTRSRGTRADFRAAQLLACCVTRVKSRQTLVMPGSGQGNSLHQAQLRQILSLCLDDAVCTAGLSADCKQSVGKLAITRHSVLLPARSQAVCFSLSHPRKVRTVTGYRYCVTELHVASLQSCGSAFQNRTSIQRMPASCSNTEGIT